MIRPTSLALAALLTLSACGGDDDPSDPENGANGTDTTAVDSAGNDFTNGGTDSPDQSDRSGSTTTAPPGVGSGIDPAERDDEQSQARPTEVFTLFGAPKGGTFEEPGSFPYDTDRADCGFGVTYTDSSATCHPVAALAGPFALLTDTPSSGEPRAIVTCGSASSQKPYLVAPRPSKMGSFADSQLQGADRLGYFVTRSDEDAVVLTVIEHDPGRSPNGCPLAFDVGVFDLEATYKPEGGALRVDTPQGRRCVRRIGPGQIAVGQLRPADQPC